MKSFVPYLFSVTEKYQRLKILIGISLLINFVPAKISAQCSSGYTRDTINWDYLDYFHRSGATYGGINPATSLPFVTAAMAQIQSFAISDNKFTINTTMGIGGISPFLGDVNIHTAQAGSYGNGEDVKFMGLVGVSGTITMSFQSPVQNIQFSLYDVDYSQRVTVTAVNGIVPQNITMSIVSGAVLTVLGSGTISANAKAAAVAVANTSTDGTVNVSIAGPVTSVTLTVTETAVRLSGPVGGQEDGGIFLSDISACIANPSFPVNYYAAYTQPFTNQPAYFIANPQSLHVYMINANTGEAEFLFSDPGLVGNKLNSIAYDPVNHFLYYVMDNSAQAAGNLSLKKYDFNTETVSTIIPNIASFGIPTFMQGMEYAAAAFYNGSLYLGIEGTDGTSYTTGAESVIWKIDFDVLGIAASFSQVFATPGDNGAGSLRHDWGDFAIKDGLIISQATGPTSTSNYYTHYNLQTGTTITYPGNAETAGQMGQTWNGNIYRTKNAIALYNNDGTIGAQTTITASACSPAWVGNAGDASDPFKPKCDFGDAPASYDPDPLSPAVHQKHCNNANLRLGANWDREWSKNTSADATGDATDEDAISTVALMISDGLPHNHVQQLTVLNNTGADATLGGWLDYDADGLFEASEGVIVTVPSNATPQTVYLLWSGITVAIGTPNTFLRIRLVSGTTNALTINNASGWYNDGEVEDYRVLSVAEPLTIRLIDFNAYVTNDKNVLLNWKAVTNEESLGFEIQRSSNQNEWKVIGWKNKNDLQVNSDYYSTDLNPLNGSSFYRLRMVEKDGSSKLSHTKKIQIDMGARSFGISPNPARNNATILFTSNNNSSGKLNIINLAGQVISSKPISIRAGENQYPIDLLFSSGVYVVEIVTAENVYSKKLTVY